MEIYIKTCYDALIRLTGDFFIGRNRSTVYATTACRPNTEITIDFVSDAESDRLNKKYHIKSAPERYAGYILEELNNKILDNIGKLETLIIDYKDIENIVFNDRIPEEIKEGKLRIESISFSDPLYNEYKEFFIQEK